MHTLELTDPLASPKSLWHWSWAPACWQPAGLMTCIYDLAGPGQHKSGQQIWGPGRTKVQIRHKSPRSSQANSHDSLALDARHDTQPSDCLATSFAQDKSAGGVLSVNTDPIIQEVLEETLTWERLRLSLPFPAAEVAGQRERLRKTRINAAAVARSYNKVLTPLNPFLICLSYPYISELENLKQKSALQSLRCVHTLCSRCMPAA